MQHEATLDCVQCEVINPHYIYAINKCGVQGAVLMCSMECTGASAGAGAGAGAGADAVFCVLCAVCSVLPDTCEDLAVQIRFLNSLHLKLSLGQKKY